MYSNTPKKIHIIGPVGSGKTTLAKALSSILDITYYELDNVIWKRTKNGDIRNSIEERDRQFHNIINSNSWITEGAHYTWVSQGFQNAELIIFLDIVPSKRKFRIIKRFVYQKLGLEKSNYKPTIAVLRKMFKWHNDFEKEGKSEILKLLVPYNEKLLILKDNSEMDKYFVSLLVST